ncbi:MAG: hypothetical protein IJ250_06795 [Bacteroidales bacterium]|nr:hypothetical protein [Bacteroidales bacterium]
METLVFLIIGIGLAFLIGNWGKKRKIGFGWAFAISIISPLIGAIVVACSAKKEEFVEMSNKEGGIK